MVEEITSEKAVPMEVQSAPAPVKISFGLKRKEEVKIVQPAAEIISVPVDSDEERELEETEREAKRRKLTHFEDGGAPLEADEKKKKSSVVIPLVIENDWRVAKLLELEKEGKATDADRAKLAILTEDKPFQAGEAENNGDAIVVDGDVKVTDDADYSAVSIEDYGLAILRGCGWKEGEGIGRRPQVVPLRLPNRRPKGLGLGATPKEPEKGKKGEKGKEGAEKTEKEIAKGSHVRITGGRHDGKYGMVEARDDDNNSVFVRLALGGETVKVSLFVAEPVSKKEYERDSKCINKGEYDREKERIDKKREKMEGSRDRREREERREKDRSRHHEREGTSKQSSASSSSSSSSELWVRPDLTVRFVDDSYKGGKLFGSKLRVVDVASRKDISLEDENGRIHYSLRQSHMETVIPRNEGEKVMIVRGRYAGSIAIMERKNKKECTIVARILRNSKVVDIDFDDVCHFKPKNEDDYDD